MHDGLIVKVLMSDQLWEFNKNPNEVDRVLSQDTLSNILFKKWLNF